MTDDEPTDALLDNAVDVEWSDDDTISLPDVKPKSEAEELLELVNHVIANYAGVEFHKAPPQVIVTRVSEQGDTLSIHESFRERSITEALRVAVNRLDLEEFDAIKLRRKAESRFWPYLIRGGDVCDVVIQEFPPFTSVAGYRYGPGLETYREACEWLQKAIAVWESEIHDDCPTDDQLKRRTQYASDARQKVQEFLAAWEQVEKVEREWNLRGSNNGR